MTVTHLLAFSGVDSSDDVYEFRLEYDNLGTTENFEDDTLKIVMTAGSMNLNAIYLSDGDAKAWEAEVGDPFAKEMLELPSKDEGKKASGSGGRKANRLSPALNMNGSGVSWDSLLAISEPGLAGSKLQKVYDITNFLYKLDEDGVLKPGKLSDFRDDADPERLIFGFRATSVNGGDSIKLVQEYPGNDDINGATAFFDAVKVAMIATVDTPF